MRFSDCNLDEMVLSDIWCDQLSVMRIPLHLSIGMGIHQDFKHHDIGMTILRGEMLHLSKNVVVFDFKS